MMDNLGIHLICSFIAQSKSTKSEKMEMAVRNFDTKPMVFMFKLTENENEISVACTILKTITNLEDPIKIDDSISISPSIF